MPATKSKAKPASHTAKLASHTAKPAAKHLPALSFPNPGFGLGLRTVHYDYILKHLPKVDWFEIISENYMDTRGQPRRWLDRIREHYPIIMHGVSMNIGSTQPLDLPYLKRLRAFRDEIGALWVSDHLCWTGVGGKNTHQLLPTPYTEEVLKITVKRIKQVQDVLEAPLLLENPSSYFEFTQSSMHEADFIRRMAEESGCCLLLDVNNVYVSAFNHDFDALDYIARIPHERVVQYHLAGHTRFEKHILDTHSDHVIAEVWKLLKDSYPRTLANGRKGAAVMVEWDESIPAFRVLFAELQKAKKACAAAVKSAAGKRAEKQTGSGMEADQAACASKPLPALKLYPWVQTGIETWADDSDPNIALQIRPNSRLAPAERFEIYSRDYYGRFRDVLASDYEAVAAAVGDKKWPDLADKFVQRWPSRSPNLNNWGAEFPAFIAEETATEKLANRAALADLATLERAVSVSSLLDDSQARLSPDALGKLSPGEWARLRLAPVPSVQLVELSYPVNAVLSAFYAAQRHAHDGGSAAGGPGATSATSDGHSHTHATAASKAVKLPRKRVKQWVQVYRKDERTWRMALPAPRAALLRALMGAKSLGAALDAASSAAADSTAHGSEADDIAANIQDWFADWMSDGIFAAATTHQFD
jgi:uncharacterized protein (UPF0276 family)